MLGRQEQKRGARSAKTSLTGLTGPSGSSAKNPSNKSKARPSFKELLAKYEKEEAVQKQKGWLNKVKDAKTSSKHQEQSDSHLSQGNYATEPYSFYRPIAPWYCWYLYYIYLDYSRMYMQSYFIHYPSIYLSCTS